MRTRLTATLAALIAGPGLAQMTETPDIAAKIGEMGPELSREMVGGTMGLYKPLHDAMDMSGVAVTRDQSYGPAERNMLDVYAPEGADGSQPVMIWVHGGGFVRGDKSGAVNIGAYFAQHGVVTIPINYRFAPDSTWPSGAEDVAAAIRWVHDNPDVHGGDPWKIVLAGNSAGSMHVADYTFREDQQVEDDGVIGAILISTPSIDLTDHELDPQRDALYYGPDGDRAEQSVVNALDGRKIPLMISYAEHEPQLVFDQTMNLLEGLVARDGQLPVIVAAPGHNHISVAEHFGTADETLGPDMLEFISLQAMQSE